VTALRNIGAIVNKEWRHYFGSPIAYITLFVWLALFGLFFSITLGYFVAASSSPTGGGRMSLNDWVIGATLQSMAVVTLFVAPLLTMRLFAEEKRQGTLELLATAPLTNLQIILGKFLGALGLYALMLLLGLLNAVPLWFAAQNPPEWRPVATSLLALLLLGGALIAVGSFLSSLTRTQIVAGALTFGVALAFWILSWTDDPTAATPLKVLAYLGLLGHTEDLMKGVIDLKHVVYYLTFTVFGLFLTHQSLEAQRWRA
jgi:ABC-2 type transport system permease protein